MTGLGNKISFYGLLKNEPVGNKENLRSHFEKIGGQSFDEIYRSSMLVGILSAGTDGMFEKRYKVTEFGKKQIVAFIELNAYLEQLEFWQP